MSSISFASAARSGGNLSSGTLCPFPHDVIHKLLTTTRASHDARYGWFGARDIFIPRNKKSPKMFLSDIDAYTGGNSYMIRRNWAFATSYKEQIAFDKVNSILLSRKGHCLAYFT